MRIHVNYIIYVIISKTSSFFEKIRMVGNCNRDFTVSFFWKIRITGNCNIEYTYIVKIRYLK